jgi:hypothetical protein
VEAMENHAQESGSVGCETERSMTQHFFLGTLTVARQGAADSWVKGLLQLLPDLAIRRAILESHSQGL